MNPPSEDSKVRIIKNVRRLGNISKSPSVLGREAGEAAVNVRSLTPKILGWQEPAKLFKVLAVSGGTQRVDTEQQRP